MQRRTLAAAITAALTWQGSALADSDVDERLLRLEERLEYLEKRVETQAEVIQSRDQRISELEAEVAQDGQTAGNWRPGLELGGLLELEATHSRPFRGNSTSDLAVATAELDLSARVNNWVSGDVNLLYEEDETDLEVDVASVSVGPENGPWKLQAGRFYLPFGVFETHMVSDPLTLEIGETRETAALASLSTGGLSGSVYAFNGTNDTGEDRVDNWGAALTYGTSIERFGINGTLGYINDIGDSDSIQDSLTRNRLRSRVPGWAASGLIESGPFTLIGEYVTATRAFRGPHVRLSAGSVNPAERPMVDLDWSLEPAELGYRHQGARPSAWNLEAAYGFALAGKSASFALGYQGTEEALALELPRRRLITTLSVELLDRTALSLEWAHDRDYDRCEGGTGRSADTVTTQLAVEF